MKNDILKNEYQKAVATGKYYTAKLLKDTEEADVVQNKLLQEIILHNRQTQFGIKHNFADIKSYDDFVRNVPLTDYNYYQDDIQNMVISGNTGILFADKNEFYALTSGTTGDNKWIPLSKRSLDQHKNYVICRGLYLADQLKKKNAQKEFTGKILILMGGYVCYTDSCHEPYHSITAGNIYNIKDEYKELLVPSAGIWYNPELKKLQYLYAFWRFALIEKDIVYIATIYDDYFLLLISYLQDNWQVLCDDIEQGIIRDWDFEQIHTENTILQPDPKRAAELKEILKAGFDTSTLKKIWPNLTLFTAATCTTRPNNTWKLESLLGNVVHDFSPFGASEALFGVCLSTDEKICTLIPDSCFYEFLKDGRICTIGEVEIGKEYEMVITTTSGLYRYQMGDIVKIAGKKGKSPVVEFSGRKGIAMDLSCEKTTDQDLKKAIEESAAHFKLDYKGYCVYPSGDRTSTENLCHYVVQFETEIPMDVENQQLLASDIDERLSRLNPLYFDRKDDDDIGNLRVEFLSSAIFAEFDRKQREKVPAGEQYKRPLVAKVNA